MFLRNGISLAGLCLILTVWGCGAKVDGPDRYRVSGTITYDGKPVPFGDINFVPDTSAGGSGPQGSAKIINGRFDTNVDDGKGTVGGPMVAVINGRTKDAPGETEDQGILFTNYEQKMELPTKDETLEIVIPVIKSKK